jgi:hypothetical protein
MSHLGLIIGNAVRRVIGQSTEEELPSREHHDRGQAHGGLAH